MRFSLVNVNKDLPLTGEQGKLLYDNTSVRYGIG